MEENTRTAPAFVAYEYKETTVESRRAAEYLDGYESFGWELYDARETPAGPPGVPGAEGMTTLRLRRDRRIVNRTELTRLQRQFEACLREVQTLENSRDVHATICGLCAGVVGLAFLFCAAFTAVTAQAPSWMNILLAIPGAACCAAALPVYRRVYRRREREVEPLLDAKHEEICAICEKGHRLTNA
ncbi:MAG: hypothetical protein ACI4L8_07690 [Candidatus Fimadaptatus sp.]